MKARTAEGQPLHRDVALDVDVAIITMLMVIAGGRATNDTAFRFKNRLWRRLNSASKS